jgi:histidine triad (HIT) family protein
MNDCIFCKIVRSELPADLTFENEYVVAFPDIHPLATGHTLLIPREHYTWFYEVPEDIANELFKAAQELAVKLKSEYSADYIELKIIGIDVPHTHIHLIPRKIA